MNGEDVEVDQLLEYLVDDADKHASACLQQADIRERLGKRETKPVEEHVAICQRAWRCQLARKVLGNLRQNAAAVRIQRLVRGRLARDEVAALKLQRDIDEAVTPRGNTLVIRKQVSRMVEHKTILDALTFVKAGDSGGVQQLTKLPGIDLNNASVELSRQGLTKQKQTQTIPGKLGTGARNRLEKCRGTTLKLSSLELELSGKVGEIVQAHVKRPPSYAYDTSVGNLRVDMRVGGILVRSASKIEARNFQDPSK